MIVVQSLGAIDIIGSVDQATNGQQAVDFVKKNETNAEERYYDIVFLDIDMPILNGLETCEQMITFYKALS